MAFYLGTLVELLHKILHPDQHYQNWFLDNEKIPQIQSLFEKASFLRDFLANSTPAIQAKIETLEDQIRDAAESAEDVLESYLASQILSNQRKFSFSSAFNFRPTKSRNRWGFTESSDDDMLSAENAKYKLESYGKAQEALAHRRQMQSLFQKASLLRKFVAESAPIQANFEMLEDVITGAAKNMECIVESYTKAHDVNTFHIQSLSKKSSFLRIFFANSGPTIRAIMDTSEDEDQPWLHDTILYLEDTIRDAAELFQELVWSYRNSSSQIFMIKPPDMSEVISVFESVTAEIIRSGRSVSSSPVVPSWWTKDPTAEDMVVGLDKDLIELNDRLTSQSRTLEIIPIVGMGGIGKTTLARKQYNEHSSSKHFDICLWATISQQYDPRHVLLSLLGCTNSDKTNAELKLDLYQTLWSRRYLIVLDDVWSSNVWDDICTWAPDNNNSSRIILTTRENHVADYVSSNKYQMQLLNKEDSWELFEKFAHAGKKCPNELEEIAQEIVKKCEGLPLALKVIGGFLSGAERTKYFWEKVADGISTFIAKEDSQFSGIFSWSYANLPHYLKPCLLYIGAFPEDHEIKASRLIKLWVSEGFLNPMKDKSPEEVAEIYLNGLTDRNLIFVHKRSFGGRVKSYGMHDLLRDLCQRKAEEKKFILAKNYGESEDTLCARRVCFNCRRNSAVNFSLELMNGTRSLQVIGHRLIKVHDDFIFIKDKGFQLSRLWVLDIVRVRLQRFPEEILELVYLKHLALCIKSVSQSSLPLRLVLLQNLQTIIFLFWDVQVQNFPTAIFLLPQLRHFKMSCIYLGPLTVVPSFTFGETLQSLSYVSVEILSQLIGKLPSLKSLGIDGCDWKTEPNIDLTSFPRLQTIKIIGGYYLAPIFPQTLRELIITAHSKLSGTFMSRIGGLPNLQLLQLKSCVFENSTWESSEGEFCSLQYLLFSSWNLENWIADETHFPQLKHLLINSCHRLKEIPLEIGGIDTLEVIELDDCMASVFDSARSILQEQCDCANENLLLRLGREL